MHHTRCYVNYGALRILYALYERSASQREKRRIWRISALTPDKPSLRRGCPPQPFRHGGFLSPRSRTSCYAPLASILTMALLNGREYTAGYDLAILV
jgi:hypothetical protein